MDVMNGSGVIANFEQMVGIIQKDKDKVFEVTHAIVNSPDGEVSVVKSSLKENLLDAIYNCVFDGSEKDDVETNLKSAWGIGKRFEDAGGTCDVVAIEDGPECPTWDEAIQALKEAAAVEDDDVPAAEELLNIWDDILERCYPQVPQLEEVRAFSNSRLEGFGVPIGEACFIFSSLDIFEKKLTKKGKALKKAIGHCDESEWTTVSY